MKITRIEHNKVANQYAIVIAGSTTQFLIISVEQYESIIQNTQLEKTKSDEYHDFWESKAENVDYCKIISFTHVISGQDEEEDPASYWMKIKRCFKDGSDCEIKDYEISLDEYLMFTKDLKCNQLRNGMKVVNHFQ